ncbi:hypothetical protein L596_004441 [Steinernema carpocapsae]|uniref:Uncharacterized protein n=1 Tax=Steinernema carpocapsae TaxID=34508 RepID=A0A4U8UXF6_STECR|nr:hypothetical protein L596_004441 [Steinernema carpocapsae]
MSLKTKTGGGDRHLPTAILTALTHTPYARGEFIRRQNEICTEIVMPFCPKRAKTAAGGTGGHTTYLHQITLRKWSSVATV